MTTSNLPENGRADIAGKVLPSGRRHFSQEDGQLVAWVTEQPMAAAGRTWLALSAAQRQTGLIPVLLVQDN